MSQDFQWDIGIRCDYLMTLKAGSVTPLRDYFLGIRGSKIEAIKPWNPDVNQSYKEFIHAKNQAVMPGLINGHTHLPMTLLRGLADDEPFHDWLFKTIIPIEGKFVDPDFVRVGTELAALESIRFGVTSLFEMYFYAEACGEVLDQAGLRGYISQAMASFPLPEDEKLGNDKEKVFYQLLERFENHPRLKVALAPHAPYSCDDETLTLATKIAEKTQSRIHIHVSETAQEVKDSQKNYGKTPFKRLYDLGVLQRGAICAHGVHIQKDEFELLKKSGASVIYNPESNMKLGSGIAPIPEYLRHGIPVGLGTDGTASNNDLSIFDAMDVGAKLQKVAHSDNTAMTAPQVLRMATIEGAKALGLEKEIGSLEVGKKADLICVDLEYPHLQPIHDLCSQLVYATKGTEVRNVICDGKILMRDHAITHFDQSAIFEKARSYRDRIQEALRNKTV
jgi:5-methylthioadenosine/S-adenosylhomocysteine deaminase